VTEYEFNKKMEIEAKMAEDKDREAQRLAKETDDRDRAQSAIKRPLTSAVKRIATQGAVKRPMTPRMGRGF
jgi:pre-mRNA-splicing factor ATP-dependent RNA helicase DHX38/PRP16